MNSKHTLIVGAGRISIEQVCAVARRKISVELAGGDFPRRIARGSEFLANLLAHGGEVYGVNTGYGDNCTVAIPPALVAELPLHLTRYHGCGLGDFFDESATRAILLARLNSLSQGFSGVRWELLQTLTALLRHDVLPIIPSEGSVGASGDLTPLSYVAGVLCGEREVRYKGQIRPAADALRELNIAPLHLAPKEGLAMMNGTAVMTGLASLAYERAEYLTRLSAKLSALACLALKGNRAHFDPALFAVKPHAGQNQIAAWIYADLEDGDPNGIARAQIRLQDRYSIRCAPHVIGVLRDALPWLRRDIENELNSANDNPIIDADLERVLHGGHFYGGHIAFAMDAMKTAVANLADLMDRQLALLVDTRYNHGLPQNLSGSTGERMTINHGFKAVQITASACAAEALKLTMPASVFSRSTECHNQDKVSMGTIAARDTLRVLQLTEQVAACLTLAAVQGVHLRELSGELTLATLPDGVRDFIAAVAMDSAFLSEDRRQDGELRTTTARIQAQAWRLYP